MKPALSISTLLIFSIAFAQTVAGWLRQGNEHYREGRFPAAEAAYREAVKAEPRNETARYNLANSLVMQQKYQEAQTIYDDLAASSTEDKMRAASYYNTGVVHSSQKELESSIEAYKQALRIDPDDREARENLQKALHELRQQNQNQSSSSSNMSSGAADQKLQQLEQKEKQVQQRMQNQQQGEGGTGNKDW